MTAIPKEDLVNAAQQFENWYETLSSSFIFTDYHNNSETQRLVRSLDIKDYPIHRWYYFKEAYSPNLPIWVIERIRLKYNGKIQSVLDPFFGSGTTGVSLAQVGFSVTGFEYNPFIYLLGQTKALYPSMDFSNINQAIQSIDFSEPNPAFPMPDLTTISNPEYFSFSEVQILLKVVNQIYSLNLPAPTQHFLLVGVAGAIDDIAHLRKDGRALRFEIKPNRAQAEQAIKKRWYAMLEDVGKISYKGSIEVKRGSALNLSELENSTFDLVLYSPPYLNNFDYSEVYKLELWLLGLISSGESWRVLRKSTIRSHPSIKFDETAYLQSELTTQDIASKLKEMGNSVCLENDNTRRTMRPVIEGYFDDMFLALKEQWRVLKPGGFLAFVVGNSRHKYLPIATDVILGAIAQRIGFRPLEIIIFRKRNGRTRQKGYLRESMVLMQKPI
jgi:DNA modification methylase